MCRGRREATPERSLVPSSSPRLFQPPLWALLSPRARRDPWASSAVPGRPQSYANSSGLPGPSRPRALGGARETQGTVPNARGGGCHGVSPSLVWLPAAALALWEIAQQPAQSHLVSFTSCATPRTSRWVGTENAPGASGLDALSWAARARQTVPNTEDLAVTSWYRHPGWPVTPNSKTANKKGDAGQAPRLMPSS